MSESEKKLETQVAIPENQDSSEADLLNVVESEGEKAKGALEQPESAGNALDTDREELDVSSEKEKDASESISSSSDKGAAASSHDESAVNERANSEAEADASSNTPQKTPSEKLKRLLTNRAVLVGIGAVVVALVFAALFSTHVICFHKWASATCTEPETCEICSRTQGEPLGHDWSEATCTDPEICSRCGEAQGEALGHSIKDWITDAEATCSSTGKRHGVCTRCGETINETIPKTAHTPGEWTTKDKAKISPSGNITPGTRVQICSVCGQEIKTESFTPEISASKMNALKRAGSYLNSNAFSEQSLIEQLEFEGFPHDDAVWGVRYCGADWNAQAVKKAKSYLSWGAFSHSGLVEQLEFEGFTHEQAEYGVSKAGL